MWRLGIILALIVESGYAGFERTNAGSRPQALGGAVVGLSDEVWSIFYNPAGIFRLSGYQISCFYAPQPFGLTELSTSAFAGTVPMKFGAIGISIRRYGFEFYRENSFSLAYANNIAGLYCGVNLNYHTVSIKNYGSSGTFGLDIGILTPLTADVSLGAAIKNINSPTIGISREKLPQSFSTGIAYKPVESMILVAAIQKESSFTPAVQFGFEYWIVEAVAIRGGITNEPVQYCGGIGVRLHVFRIDYGFSIHQELGMTHSISLIME